MKSAWSKSFTLIPKFACVFVNSGEQKNWLKTIEVSGKTLLRLISKCNFMRITYGDSICHLHNSLQQ